MRILQIEDDSATARAVERILTSLGYECETTGLGREGVALAANNGYDLILLDVMLPDIDGYEVLQHLHEAAVDTPIVIESGLIGRDGLARAPDYGVKDYLIKPFTRQELVDCITSTLGRVELAGPAVHPDGPPAQGADNPGAPRRKDGSGRRHQPRVRTLKSGQIIYRNFNCIIDCLILNLSEHGAAIQPSDFVDLPDTFLLKVQYGPTYHCEVCWRQGNKLGVYFIHPGSAT